MASERLRQQEDKERAIALTASTFQLHPGWMSSSAHSLCTFALKAKPATFSSCSDFHEAATASAMLRDGSSPSSVLIASTASLTVSPFCGDLGPLLTVGETPNPATPTCADALSESSSVIGDENVFGLPALDAEVSIACPRACVCGSCAGDCVEGTPLLG